VVFLQLWPNGWMDQDATEVGLGPGHIVLDGDPVGTQRLPQQPLPTFRSMSIAAIRSPISATAELWLDFVYRKCKMTEIRQLSTPFCDVDITIISHV